MEQQVDEINKIIHVKCTKEEKTKLLADISKYPLYDYQFNFILEDDYVDEKK
ncbi:MAG: hypothetical protein K0S41_751 [Anaerocolumna sp.]|jgi:hypothetical protein|nr:hypothetical protein [Anaerocolumna sp.]